jgi:RNA polymerase sigma-70 factor, ECF subfamily
MTLDDFEAEARFHDSARGDKRAAQWLMELHRGRLRRMIAVRLDDRISALLDPSDVVQEALADAARKLISVSAARVRHFRALQRLGPLLKAYRKAQKP